jgi:hypothetical protein
VLELRRSAVLDGRHACFREMNDFDFHDARRNRY